MDKNDVAGETYEAFKTRKRREINSRLAGRTQATKQKLLRVHLQHFLETIGDEINQRRRRNEPHLDVPKHNEYEGINRILANEQKQLAIAREAAKAERNRSATRIQKFVRRRQYSRDKVAENEEELLSTSVLIPIMFENQVVALKATVEIPPVKVDAITIELPRILPPYELVIQVVGARDLALYSSLDENCLEIEMLLKRQSVVVSRVEPARQFVSSVQDHKTEIPLCNYCLRFSLDLDNGLAHGLASPQSVIDELIATVIVKDIGGSNASMLGVVEIPMSLLETPFATEYALCRWFPLEKAFSGHIVRGDLRVSVCYLMRQTTSDTAVMIPYVNTTSKNDETQVELERKKPVTRRVKKPATAQRKPARKAFERGQARGKSEKFQPAIHSQDSAITDRIPRAEALSPPSSPSSVASSEPSDNVDLPKPVKPGRRPFPPRRQLKSKADKAVRNPPPMEEQPAEMKENSSRTPPKNFLKRKPYKVVFHKLDWSGVASKTDSNLPTNGSTLGNSGVGAKPSKSLRSSKASRTSTTPNVCDSTGMNVDSIITPKPGAFIDAATAQRLATLENAMYERCGVTRETASLIHFKHQKERKKFVATIENQAQARRGDAEVSAQSEQPPSRGSSEIEVCSVISEAAVTGLWKKLTSDSSGQIYASMLRSFIEEQVKVIEPTEQIDNR